jgi:hypothetical protein
MSCVRHLHLKWFTETCPTLQTLPLILSSRLSTFSSTLSHTLPPTHSHNTLHFFTTQTLPEFWKDKNKNPVSTQVAVWYIHSIRKQARFSLGFVFSMFRYFVAFCAFFHIPFFLLPIQCWDVAHTFMLFYWFAQEPVLSASLILVPFLLFCFWQRHREREKMYVQSI